MKITKLGVKNFRTLENTYLEFPSYYSAICGKNDSGKTNVVRVVRSIMQDELPYYRYRNQNEIKYKDDFTKWVSNSENNKNITFEIQIEVDRFKDEALFQFILTHLKITESHNNLVIDIAANYFSDKSSAEVSTTILGNTYAGLEAQEVLKRLQSSNSIFFHNSTEPDHMTAYEDFSGLLKEFSPEYRTVTDDIAKSANQKLNRLAKGPQKEISELLGRLNEKYKVGITLPRFNLDYWPVNITLGDKKIDVPLREWGSGTKNRTLILLTLFKARQISHAETSTEKITPIIVIEEPESFLHPSAQAEFGQILQDLAEEFQVQVIVTTHSPYLLSHDNPLANILLDRKLVSNQVRETVVIETEGERWMEPFGLALGVTSSDLQPWKQLFFSNSDCILLVEGETDKEYFELLRDPCHGDKGLCFEGEIFPYGGSGNLKNNVLIRFIRDRYKKIFITYDLDVEGSVEKTFQALSMEKHKDYMAIGLNRPAKKNIEGLLPNTVISKVYADNPTLVQEAAHGDREESKSAKNQLKKLYLEEFKRQSSPGEEFYGGFYKMTPTINKAFSKFS
ncbi:MAG: ATP-binding protein [Desulfobulbaceae bacterium]|nr:ATP-binding protein [Desulfobulbaceae bacterium]